MDSNQNELSVISLNIAHGRGNGMNQMFLKTRTIKKNLDAIAVYLKEVSPDVVGLQEVDVDAAWTGNFDQAEYLANKAGYPYFRTGINNQKRGMIDLVYGNAILSKYPILKNTTYPFGKALIGEKGFMVADLDVKGKTISVAVAHLDFKFASNRRRQTQQMIDVLEKHSGPLVVMGDFNCDTGAREPTLSQFLDALDLELIKTSPTFPSDGPRTRIDHVFCNGGLKIQSARPESVILSDHLPVLAMIRMP